jgi:hypothetical protein
MLQKETEIYQKQQKSLPTLLLNDKTKAFWRQRDFWKDKNPLPIDEFIAERLKSLNLIPTPKQLEIIMALAGRDPYEWETTYQVYTIAIGMGGGKNEFIVSPFLAYLTYKIANMHNPYLYFQQMRNAKINPMKNIDIVNMSVVGDLQAKNVHFNNMINLIRNCYTKDGDNWFEKYVGMDMREGGFGDIKTREVVIPTTKGLGKIVHHSFDSTFTAWEGLQILLALNDEVSRANTKATYSEFELSWKGQLGNINTRFPNRVGKILAISYLNNSQYDFMNTLLKQAEEEKKHTDRPLMFSCNLSTFECNPNVTKDSDEIKSAYRNDPQDARARYEGIKGSPIEGFFQPYPEKIEECFYESMPTPIDYSYKITTRIVRDPNTQAEVQRQFTSLALNSIKGDSRVRGFVIDPATKFDAFTLKGGYIETMDEFRENLFIDNRKELVTINKRPIIDIVLVWQPQKGFPVDYINVGEVIGHLLSEFPNTRFLTSDKYNSEKLSQEAIARGVHSETFGYGNTQQVRLFKKLRLLVFNNIPQIYKDQHHSITKKGITKTVGEWDILELQELLKINDNKIDHPSPDGSKDFCDVSNLLVDGLTHLEINDGSLGSSQMTDRKLLALGEKYLVTRARLKHQGVKETDKDYIKKVAEMMNIEVGQAKTIKEFAEVQFSGLL